MVSIIIPTYNEAESISPLVAGIHKALGGRSYEVFVVDDQSTDGTAGVVARLAWRDRRVRMVCHPSPRDLGKSVLMGVGAARGNVIVGMDADGNHDPRYLPHLLSALKDADLVVGSRFKRSKFRIQHTMDSGSEAGMTESGFRYWGSLLLNAVLRYSFRFPIWDNTSGFYAIRRKTLLSLDPPSIYYGYGEYHLRLVYQAWKKELRIVEVPVYYPPRIHGQSKSRLFIMLGTYLATAVRLRLG